MRSTSQGGSPSGVGAVDPEALFLQPLDASAAVLVMRSISSHSLAPAEVLTTVGETGAEPRSRISTRPTPGPFADAQEGAEVARILDVLEQHDEVRIAGRGRAASAPRPPAAHLGRHAVVGRPGVSESAALRDDLEGDPWRGQSSSISSRRRPVRLARDQHPATSCGRCRSASRTGW